MKKYQTIPKPVFAQQINMKNVNQAVKNFKPYGDLTFYKDGWFSFKPKGHTNIHFQQGDYLVMVNGKIYAMDEHDFERLYEEVPYA